jgi:cytoskeletal protein RodZ
VTSVTLGEILRQARERRGLTLDEVASRTRIPKRHLEALELNSLAGIPSGMYQRAEVRTYADAIGLDPQLALVALGRTQAASTPVASTPAATTRAARTVATRRRAKRRRARLALTAAVLMAVPIGAAGVFWWRQASGTVGVVPPAVEEKAVTTSLRPSPAADPAPSPTGAATAAATTPSPGASESTPQVFDNPDLRVITEPAGARVTVDGVGWGQSPLTIRALTPGARVVRVTLDGYAAQERRVAVSRDTARTTVRITLRPVR